MLRIVFTGPESTGKTTLALKLASHYGVPWVPEYARIYLNEIKRDYQEKDLVKIAEGQLFREDRIGKGKPPLLFCDTDLVTLKIWSDYKYGKTDSWILQQIQSRTYDYYFLCGTDILWEFDPQREHPNQREKLYQLYCDELQSYQKPFTEIKGSLEERLKKCISVTEKLLAFNS